MKKGRKATPAQKAQKKNTTQRNKVNGGANRKK